MCNKEFVSNNLSQKYCGSSTKKTGCSYKNKVKTYPQIRVEKTCCMCYKLFVPKNNQKYCGGKFIKNTCSWINQQTRYSNKIKKFYE